MNTELLGTGTEVLVGEGSGVDWRGMNEDSLVAEITGVLPIGMTLWLAVATERRI